MKKTLTVSLYFLVLSTSGYSQKYFAECLSTEGYAPEQVKVNKSGEIFFSATSPTVSGDIFFFKLDKDGKQVWKKEFEGYITAIWVDELGNSYVQTSTFTSTTRFHKFRPDGTPGWNADTFVFPSIGYSEMDIDGQGNIYFLSTVDHTDNPWIDNLYVSKYSSSGNPVWQTLITDNSASYSDMVVKQSGEVFTTTVLYDGAFTLKRVEVTKLSAAGAIAWKSDLPYANNNPNINLRLQPSLALDGSGNLLEIIYYESYEYYVGTQVNSVELARINASSGLTTGYKSMPSREVVVAFGANTTFLMDRPLTYGGSGFKVLQLADNLTTINEYPVGSSFGTLLIGPSNTFYLTSRTISAWLVTKFTNGVIDWKFAEQSYVYSAATVFDGEGKVLFASGECLKKIHECGNTQVSISSQPSNTEVCPGDNATFSAQGVGLGVHHYWYKGTVLLSNSTKFSGVTTTQLMVKQASLSDAGSYYCEVRDGCGKFINSQVVTLNVVQQPTLTKQPLDVSQCVGTDVVFQVTTSGGKNVKYQWKKGATPLVESAILTGTKTNKLTVKTVALTDAGEYFCEVIADCSPLTVSQKATLGVLSPTMISTNPKGLASCTGATVNFSVSASGTALTYQWKKGGTDLAETSRILGTKTATLSLSVLQVSDAGEYTCTVSSSCGGSITTTAAALAVGAHQQISTQPVSSTLCSGANVNFSVVVTGTGATYQWRKGNTVVANNTKYSGVTTATLSVSSASVAEEGAYTCEVTTACGDKIISSAAQLRIGTAASITGKSADLELCSGGLAKFYITFSGGVASYQWKKNGSVLNDNAAITGSRTAELVVQDLAIADAGSYSCEIVASCGSNQVSGAIQLAIREQVKITEQPLLQDHCETEDVVLAIKASGYTPLYQWKKDGSNVTDGSALSGAKTAQLMLKDLSVSFEGYYACEVTGCGGSVSSENVLVKVNPKPALIAVNRVDCDNFVKDWSSIVIDTRNTSGNYFLFPEGSAEPLASLREKIEPGHYRIVKVTSTCSDTLAWENLCMVTGSDEHPIIDITISPNPTTRWIQIRYDPVAMKEFEIFDSRGINVARGALTNAGETLVDGDRFASGVYLVVLHDDGGHRTFQRLIIQR